MENKQRPEQNHVIFFCEKADDKHQFSQCRQPVKRLSQSRVIDEIKNTVGLQSVLVKKEPFGIHVLQNMTHILRRLETTVVEFVQPSTGV